MEITKIYRGKVSYLLLVLLIPIFLTFGLIVDNDFNNASSTTFLALFWGLFLVPVFLPLAYKLEVGNNFVKKSFLGFNTMNVSSKNVESSNYGGIGLWDTVYSSGRNDIVHGKGLAILAHVDGARKTYGISEKLYGEEAIRHVREILEISS